jgi:ferrochelatase
MTRAAAVVVVAHGTVDSLDELPELLANIRRGHAAPPELLAEVRRRYEAIGGRSPLNAINREVARGLEARLGVPVRAANRLFRPYPKEVLEALAREGVERVAVVPLAQHSAHVYGEAVKQAAREVPGLREVVCAENWGRAPGLTRAFAAAAREALARVPEAERGRAAIVFTAHSLPLSVIEAGDPYEREVRASADAVARELARELGPDVAPIPHLVAFQSQGMSAGPGGRPIAWLGPELRTALASLAERGARHVVLAPIGFLADHVEILYDLDIEAKGWGEELGIVLYRSASLNAGDPLLAVLEGVARELLGRG